VITPDRLTFADSPERGKRFVRGLTSDPLDCRRQKLRGDARRAGLQVLAVTPELTSCCSPHSIKDIAADETFGPK
jgi:hypothetical protein